ncbi:hypothetical protein U0070_022860 [Myodes glareolus]|uniref:Uncharacterized protein n=1 Tax=Myodes glareolus TaxID=447135 RepID=A0AAW0K6F6_MYOGA
MDGIFGVKGQRVATTQHQVDTLTNRNRLKEFDDVCVSVSQDANFINIDNDITCKEKGEIDNYSPGERDWSFSGLQNSYVVIDANHRLVKPVSSLVTTSALKLTIQDNRLFSWARVREGVRLGRGEIERAACCRGPTGENGRDSEERERNRRMDKEEMRKGNKGWRILGNRVSTWAFLVVPSGVHMSVPGGPFRCPHERAWWPLQVSTWVVLIAPSDVHMSSPMVPPGVHVSMWVVFTAPSGVHVGGLHSYFRSPRFGGDNLIATTGDYTVLLSMTLAMWEMRRLKCGGASIAVIKHHACEGGQKQVIAGEWLELVLITLTGTSQTRRTDAPRTTDRGYHSHPELDPLSPAIHQENALQVNLMGAFISKNHWSGLNPWSLSHHPHWALTGTLPGHPVATLCCGDPDALVHRTPPPHSTLVLQITDWVVLGTMSACNTAVRLAMTKPPKRLGHFYQRVPGRPPLSQMSLDWLSNVLSSSESSLSMVPMASELKASNRFPSGFQPRGSQGTQALSARTSPCFLWSPLLLSSSEFDFNGSHLPLPCCSALKLKRLLATFQASSDWGFQGPRCFHFVSQMMKQEGRTCEGERPPQEHKGQETFAVVSSVKCLAIDLKDITMVGVSGKMPIDLKIKRKESLQRQFPGSRELTCLHFPILRRGPIRDHTFHLEKLVRLIAANDGESKAHVALLEGGAEEGPLQLGRIPGEERLFYIGQHKLKRERRF